MNEENETDESPKIVSEKAPRIISSQELLQGERELKIEHEGKYYYLKVTAAGHLYMTK